LIATTTKKTMQKCMKYIPPTVKYTLQVSSIGVDPSYFEVVQQPEAQGKFHWWGKNGFN